MHLRNNLVSNTATPTSASSDTTPTTSEVGPVYCHGTATAPRGVELEGGDAKESEEAVRDKTRDVSGAATPEAERAAVTLCGDPESKTAATHNTKNALMLLEEVQDKVVVECEKSDRVCDEVRAMEEAIIAAGGVEEATPTTAALEELILAAGGVDEAQGFSRTSAPATPATPARTSTSATTATPSTWSIAEINAAWMARQAALQAGAATSRTAPLAGQVVCASANSWGARCRRRRKRPKSRARELRGLLRHAPRTAEAFGRRWAMCQEARAAASAPLPGSSKLFALGGTW
eukprot:g16563.t1